MLSHLRISNFALLEEIDIEFTKGLALFTGETGAGKSILIDAICRLLGARATQDDVRSGASKTLLEAEFDAGRLPEEARALLEGWQIDLEEDNLILRREIQSSGKSRALLNNCAVTLQQLKLLAPFLIDVFGQNEHQTLLDSNPNGGFTIAPSGFIPKFRSSPELLPRFTDCNKNGQLYAPRSNNASETSIFFNFKSVK